MKQEEEEESEGVWRRSEANGVPSTKDTYLRVANYVVEKRNTPDDCKRDVRRCKAEM